MTINSIRLQNFKGFKDATLPLKPLTVILGPNSSGKSCFGQALAALSKGNESRGTLSLAFDPDSSIEFGGYSDLVHHECQGQSVFIEIGLGIDMIRLGFGPGDEKAGIDELELIHESINRTLPTATDSTSQVINIEQIDRNTKLEWAIENPKNDSVPLLGEPKLSLNFKHEGIIIDLVKKITGGEVPVVDILPITKQKSELLASVLRGVSYLRPDRTSPKRKHPMPSGTTPKIDDFGGGTDGFIHKNKDKLFDCFFFPNPSPDKDESKKILHKYEGSLPCEKTLLEVLNRWLVELGLTEFFDINLLDGGESIQSVATPIGQITPRPLTDIGYGVSQVLPILVKGITIKKNDWLVVEQPEAQLHPKPQAGLADFFCSMVRCGRNVIVETHSVELFHRLRLRASMDHELEEKIGVYFMHQPVDGACCEPVPVPLREESELDWPEGFLPEAIKSEMEILATRLARMEMD